MKKFEMTPTRRISLAFICGWGFATCINAAVLYYADHWNFGVATSFVFSIIFLVIASINKRKFELEHTFMLLKQNYNSRDDTAKAARPMRPPSPPAPPRPKVKKWNQSK